MGERARGELGLVAFLLGDINASVIALGQALKVAQASGDTPSLVRWLMLFGHGYVQLGRPEEALDFYDRALAVAATVPELHFPLMTHVGRGDALYRAADAGDVRSAGRATPLERRAGIWRRGGHRATGG
jgi:tetratricopeptide (TPR) repeat protein